MSSNLDNYTTIIALIKGFAGQSNLLSCPRPFIDFMGNEKGGDLAGGFFLSQIIFNSDKGRDENGQPSDWFWKTNEQWEQETSLSAYQIRKYTKRCEAMGFLETKFEKPAGHSSPKNLYRVDLAAFATCFAGWLEAREKAAATDPEKDRPSKDLKVEGQKSERSRVKKFEGPYIRNQKIHTKDTYKHRDATRAREGVDQDDHQDHDTAHTPATIFQHHNGYQGNGAQPTNGHDTPTPRSAPPPSPSAPGADIRAVLDQFNVPQAQGGAIAPDEEPLSAADVDDLVQLAHTSGLSSEDVARDARLVESRANSWPRWMRGVCLRHRQWRVPPPRPAQSRSTRATRPSILAPAAPPPPVRITSIGVDSLEEELARYEKYLPDWSKAS